jgi:hypothetical protein
METHAQEVLDKFDRELVSLVPLKLRIRQIAALLAVDRVRRRLELASEAPILHMSFTGTLESARPRSPPGWPKILHKLGYIRKAKSLLKAGSRRYDGP